MENEEKLKTKFAQLLASFSSFLRGHQTFADLLITDVTQTEKK